MGRPGEISISNRPAQASKDPQSLSGSLSLADRLRQWRNRIIASPRFQRWAARTPLFCRIANRRAAELHHITAGFVYSQTLLAAVELDLFDHLRAGPRDVRSLADDLQLTPEALETLLRACGALKLTARFSNNRWGLGETGAAMLGNPGVAAMVRHHTTLYADLSDPVALLRDRSHAQLAQFWNYSVKPAAEQADYSTLMADSQGLVADHVLDCIDLRANQHLLDIAGGFGSFARHVRARYPKLTVSVLDLPGVVQTASESALPGNEAIGFLPGDMFTSPLPTGVDVVSLIRILHDHDDGPVQQLLNHLYAQLPDDGQLIVAEPMAETPGVEPIGDSYFGLYLWAMGQGRPRSARTLRAMLAKAGFVAIAEPRSRMPVLVRVLTARKKSKF